jgi:hypothetical protein
VFSNWKQQLQSLARGDTFGGKPNGDSFDASEEAQVDSLRKMLSELRGGAIAGATPESMHAAPATAQRAEPAPEPSHVVSEYLVKPEEIAAAAKLIAEQREAAERLLADIRSLEERLKAEVDAARAAREYAAAMEKAEAAAALDRQAKEMAAAAVERYHAAVTERKEADLLVAMARADAQGVESLTAELEQRLSEAQQRKAEIGSLLVQYQARVEEYAANERDAASKADEATELRSSCEATYAQAEREAQAAKERLDFLKRSFER